MLLRLKTTGVWIGVLAFWLTKQAFKMAPGYAHQHGRDISPDPIYAKFICQYAVLLIGGFITSFALTPTLLDVAAFCRRRLRKEYSYFALVVVCGCMWAFVVHFGRSQFGAFDYIAQIDVGWRQVTGQHMYVDFITTTPVGFNLGILYAYKLFGVSWDAGLFLAAIVTCGSFLWMYWLLVRMSLGRPAAMATAFAIEACTMLLLCFWWYNNSALLSASIFLLSCLLYAKRRDWLPAEISYFASLTVLLLMKPNIAGVTIIGGIVLLWINADRRWRVIGWTAAAGLASLLTLAVNHVSLPALVRSYHGASQERGLFSTWGFTLMSRSDRLAAAAWATAFSIPMMYLLPRMRTQFRAGDWKGLAFHLFFPLSLLVALYGVVTNGEFREMEWAVLLATSGVIAFGMRVTGTLGRRVYIAAVCTAMLGNLYQGEMRLRVYTIGVHKFFEWEDDQHAKHADGDGFLKNMRLSPRMIETEREVRLAKEATAQPYFFGPQLGFNYAVFGLESPRTLPVWWHPGTSFARKDEQRLVKAWEDYPFETLIFLKGDYTYYPEELLDAIKRDYVRDDQYPSITVYRRRHTA